MSSFPVYLFSTYSMVELITTEMISSVRQNTTKNSQSLKDCLQFYPHAALPLFHTPNLYVH